MLICVKYNSNDSSCQHSCQLKILLKFEQFLDNATEGYEVMFFNM